MPQQVPEQVPEQIVERLLEQVAQQVRDNPSVCRSVVPLSCAEKVPWAGIMRSCWFLAFKVEGVRREARLQSGVSGLYRISERLESESEAFHDILRYIHGWCACSALEIRCVSLTR